MSGQLGIIVDPGKTALTVSGGSIGSIITGDTQGGKFVGDTMGVEAIANNAASGIGGDFTGSFRGIVAKGGNTGGHFTGNNFGGIFQNNFGFSAYLAGNSAAGQFIAPANQLGLYVGGNSWLAGNLDVLGTATQKNLTVTGTLSAPNAQLNLSSCTTVVKTDPAWAYCPVGYPFMYGVMHSGTQTSIRCCNMN